MSASQQIDYLAMNNNPLVLTPPPNDNLDSNPSLSFIGSEDPFSSALDVQLIASVADPSGLSPSEYLEVKQQMTTLEINQEVESIKNFKELISGGQINTKRLRKCGRNIQSCEIISAVKKRISMVKNGKLSIKNC